MWGFAPHPIKGASPLKTPVKGRCAILWFSLADGISFAHKRRCAPLIIFDCCRLSLTPLPPFPRGRGVIVAHFVRLCGASPHPPKTKKGSSRFLFLFALIRFRSYSLSLLFAFTLIHSYTLLFISTKD